MAEDQKQPLKLPVVPATGPTASVNVIGVGYHRGNGGIYMQVAELRESVVVTPGDPPVTAIVELARYALTPRTLRTLHDAVAKAVKDYEETEGHPLPTQDIYLTRR